MKNTLILLIVLFTTSSFGKIEKLAGFPTSGCSSDGIHLSCWGYDSYEVPAVQLTHAKVLKQGNSGSYCGIGDEGLRCFGGVLPIERKFVSPKFLSGGSYHFCLIENEKVLCFGDNSQRQLELPRIHRATALAVQGNRSCVLDDKKVKCWGPHTASPKISLVNPTHLGVASSLGCVLDQGKPVCWSLHTGKSFPVPKELTHLNQWLSDSEGFIGVDSSGVHVWYPDQPSALQSRTVSNLTSLVAGGGEYCVIADSKVLCFNSYQGTPVQVPVLTNPKQLTKDRRFNCVQADEGFKCWKEYAPDLSFIETPKPDNFVALGDYGDGDTLCRILQGELTCSGRWNTFQSAPFQNARNLALAGGNLLVVEKDRLVWQSLHQLGGGALRNEIVKGDFSRVSDVSVSDTSRCVVNSGHIQCWGKGMGADPYPNNPKLQNFRAIAACYNQICAIDPVGAKCWGAEGYFEFPLEDPTEIGSQPCSWEPSRSRENVFCAIERKGIVCFSKTGEKARYAVSNAHSLNVGENQTVAFISNGKLVSRPEKNFFPLSDKLKDLKLYPSFLKSVADDSFQYQRNYLIRLSQAFEKTGGDRESLLFGAYAFIPYLENLAAAHPEGRELRLAVRKIKSHAENQGFYSLESFTANSEVKNLSVTLLRDFLLTFTPLMSVEEGEKAKEIHLEMAGLIGAASSTKEFTRILDAVSPRLDSLFNSLENKLFVKDPVSSHRGLFQYLKKL